ncbi:hypothetical protein G647_07516 [Cladophialophora carrionii CBS 160.54]|uniref:Uncharacterized protein n=1 Tax=Cladophialophora carrionii CBS 160.54 TaxID=1279043 RepID=V9D594_9EURO|nr:uncharacterized protein G647_07516 [Cladophialophora carrionii CBS 160.54]ETI21172.1 hypothetical protein G647_07516 [Cladophialophora carrionii CBS 160.54]
MIPTFVRMEPSRLAAPRQTVFVAFYHSSPLLQSEDFRAVHLYHRNVPNTVIDILETAFHGTFRTWQHPSRCQEGHKSERNTNFASLWQRLCFRTPTWIYSAIPKDCHKGMWWFSSKDLSSSVHAGNSV